MPAASRTLLIWNTTGPSGGVAPTVIVPLHVLPVVFTGTTRVPPIVTPGIPPRGSFDVNVNVSTSPSLASEGSRLLLEIDTGESVGLVLSTVTLDPFVVVVTGEAVLPAVSRTLLIRNVIAPSGVAAATVIVPLHISPAEYTGVTEVPPIVIPGAPESDPLTAKVTVI